MNQRYINESKTKEVFLDDPNVSIWGFTHEELIESGWIKSEEPLKLSNQDCSFCEGGGGRYSLTKSYTFNIRCIKCDGTGKVIID